MPAHRLLTYLERCVQVLLQGSLFVGKISKSAILNYYGANKYAQQNHLHGNLELSFELSNILVGFIPTYVLSLSSGQKQLSKFLTTPAEQTKKFKETILTSPLLCALIMLRCLSDASTDIMVSYPILEDALTHLDQFININIKTSTICLTIFFNTISLFCDTAFNAPSELRLLKNIIKTIKSFFGFKTTTTTFTPHELELITRLLTTPHFSLDEEQPSTLADEKAPCLLTEDEQLIQQLRTPATQKIMGNLLKLPELTHFFSETLSDDETNKLLDKLTTLTFNYSLHTMIYAHLIRSAVILPTIHLVYIKNKELTESIAFHLKASPTTAQNIAYSLGSLIFFLKFISMHGKPVEYLKTALNQPLTIILKDILKTMQTHPVSLLIGIIASAPYLFFSFAQIKEVTPKPQFYWPLISAFTLAQIISYCTFVMIRIIDKFHCLDCCDSSPSQPTLQEIIVTASASTSTIHAHSEQDTPSAAFSTTEQQEEARLLNSPQTPNLDFTEQVSQAIPIPIPITCQRPTNSSANAISNTTPAMYNGPFHRLTDHDSLIP